MTARLYKNPSPYFIVLASSEKTKKVEGIEFHRIAVGAQTLLLSLLDYGQPITYHQWKNNIVCLVKKKQYTYAFHSILIQMNASYEWFRQVILHKDFKAGNMPWLAITKLYTSAYTKKWHSLF